MKVFPFVCLLLFLQQVTAITHSFNFSKNLPPHLAIMFSMSWFGITPSDPQGAGPDPSYGNWEWGVATKTCTIPTSEPATCNTGNKFTYDFSTPQRFVASKRRPLAGIYSSSARDAEGLARVDLMLSNVRRSCDGGANARLDSWSVQQNSIHFSSKYQPQGSKEYCATCDLAYRALMAFFTQAQNAGMENSVMPGIDSTWIFHFYSSVGLNCSSDKSPCINVLTEDLTDMVKISNQFGKIATRASNGLPIILVYFDGSLNFQQWESVLQNVRNSANSDFYVIGTGPGASTDMFNALDAIAPWTQADYGLNNPSYSQAFSWARAKHAPYIDSVGNYSGRVAFGSIIPGFDDYTEDWGACSPRVMERNPVFVEAATDFLSSFHVSHSIAITWDDWTEGTHFEPDVNNGTSLLISLKQGLGKLAGESPDPVGDTALNQRWISYGQARNCNGGTAGKPPIINLAC